ncbi:Aminodeoxychorismate synthase component 1 [Mixta theicola]|nr:aminodeoxychorismate synthase component 1 [Mixta theicola]QHM75285.1 Aminodeoxychorismate synthase component 1 [Mixta theicola]
MPVVYHALPYTPDALSGLFQRVAHLPWAMLLSSGFADHPDSRFDIMVADPIATLETVGRLTRIVRGDVVTESTADPLALLQAEQAALLSPVPPRGDLPFQGGALGLFGYDLGRRFERLPQQATADLATPDMAVGIYNWALVADHQQRTLTLVEHQSDGARLRWLNALPPCQAGAPFQLTSRWRSNMTPDGYRQRFDRVQAWLQAGDCYQVNLAQRFQAACQGDEWQAFQRLNRSNRAPFSAFLRLPQSVVLSLSPERFLALDGDRIETRPIKGTLPRLEDAQADRQQALRLANSEKDRAENLMIVDLLRNDIGRVAQPGSVTVPELFVVEQFPAVHHLVSTVRARLKPELSACDLLRACFPGGSITGAPKVRAMEIIETLEPQRRNAWCGSIGYLSRCGKMDSSITIRTLIVEQGQIYCAAGGGIVADSEAELEYQETLHKLRRILPVLENETR